MLREKRKECWLQRLAKVVARRELGPTSKTKHEMRIQILLASVVAEEMGELRAFDHLPMVEAVEILDNDDAAIPREFLCPISGKMLQDPVLLLPSGITYDKKFLCQELLREPDVDPFTRKRYEEKLRYCNNRLVQRLLIQKFGKSVYRPYGKKAFRHTTIMSGTTESEFRWNWVQI